MNIIQLLIAHALAITFIYVAANTSNLNQSQTIETHIIATDYLVFELGATIQVEFNPRPNVVYILATTFTPNIAFLSDYKSATKYRYLAN